ncbi:hypothetical protein H6770_03470 [Candidatus Peribacteria bacterium]|nr:hypothetical protein [Candidatus Peribacteria bacterium]
MTQEVFTEEVCSQMTLVEKVRAMHRIRNEKLEVSKEVALALTEGISSLEQLNALLDEAKIPRYDGMDVRLGVRLVNLALLEQAHNLLGTRIQLMDSKQTVTTADVIDYVTDANYQTIDLSNRIDEIPFAEEYPPE